MVAKKSDTHKQLTATGNPLLPLEYCKLGRAARMLGCEVEDLIHWGAIGAIKLCLRNPGSGMIHPSLPPNISLPGTILPNQERIRRQCKSVFQEAVRNGKAEISQYCSLSFDRQSLTCDLPEQFPPMDFMDAGGEFSFDGFWGVLDIEAIDGEYNSINPFIFPYGSGRFLYGSISRGVHLDDNFSLSEQLWIMGPDLITLNNAINNGTELQNIFNNDEIAAQAREQENLIPTKQTRLSDSSLLASIGFMAELLANLSKKYRHGEDPNAKAIRDSVIELAKSSLGEDEANALKLVNLNRDISLALKLPTE